MLKGSEVTGFQYLRNDRLYLQVYLYDFVSKPLFKL